MAKFLTTVGNSFYIEQIILNAKNSLTLVTPYLKLSKNLIERIADAENRRVKITLIYGKSALHVNEHKKLNALKNLELYFCENLHAKCYHNEDSLIITSMNLYEFSERNNREMGLLIERASDTDIYEETQREIESIKNASKVEKSFEPAVEHQQTKNSFELNPSYTESRNFHLPKTNKILNDKYSNHKITLDGVIFIENFPVQGITARIGRIVDIEFDDEVFFKKIKDTKCDKFNELLPKTRIYWNHKKFNIYPLRGYDAEISQAGFEIEVKRILCIVDAVYDIIGD
jgi:hypothetical protein